MRFLFTIIYITMSQNPRLPNGFNDITMFLVFFVAKTLWQWNPIAINWTSNIIYFAIYFDTFVSSSG